MNYLHNDIINNESSESSESSEYSDDELINIDYDTIHFDDPVKKNNLYIAYLEEKIIIELDNLDVFEIIKEDDTHYVFYNLDLDNEDQEELIELLYNLDEMALDKCYEHSIEWFKKELTEEQIENLYIPLYIENYKEKNHILMKVKINSNIDITQITNTNINIIEITGLTFYKKTFLYNISLSKIISDPTDLYSNIDNTLDITLDNTLDNTKQKHNENNKITLDNTKDTNDVGDADNAGDADNTDDKNTILNIIENKRKLVQENFLKSEKKNKEAELLRLEAIKSANELKQLEITINN